MFPKFLPTYKYCNSSEVMFHQFREERPGHGSHQLHPFYNRDSQCPLITGCQGRHVGETVGDHTRHSTKDPLNYGAITSLITIRNKTGPASGILY